MQKMFVLGVFLSLLAQPSAAMASSIDAWVHEMIGKLGFRNGKLERASFERRTEDFLASQTDYYQTVHSQFFDDPNRSEEARRRLDMIVQRTSAYAHEAEENIFRALGDTSVLDETLARQALSKLGQFADVDKDGNLDNWEAQIAEAALVRGTDINEPGAWKSLARLVALDNVRF